MEFNENLNIHREDRVMIEKRILLKNNIKLNTYVSTDDRDKPAILFIHFSGGTLQMWNGIIPFFQDQYRIIAPDLRGHGKSDRPLRGYHIDDFAHDMFLLLQELNINKCHIVGSSLGAEVGLSLAASHPEMVLSLVCEGALYNEFGEYGLYNGSLAEIEAEKERRLQHLRERKLLKYQNEEDFIEAFKEPFIKHEIWNEQTRIFLESCAEKLADGSFEHFYKNHVRIEYIQKYWEIGFEEYYKKVTCPVLFLPSKDEWANPKITHSLNYFLSFLEQYEIYHLKDSIHAYVWMQQPVKAAEAVKDFFNSQK